MKLPVFQINSFTNKVFSGNPAAVCPVENWPEDHVMQSIARKNALSETAFFRRDGKGYHIRWFSPVKEVDLCGHATLAAAFVLFNSADKPDDLVVFRSKSGELTVTREKHGLLSMNFPAQPPMACKAPDLLLEALNKDPVEILCSEDYLVVFENEKDISDLRPDMEKLNRLDLRGVIVTARSNEVDFVSRFFAPRFGIDEDPVTGSAHCILVPYWAEKLGKKELHAYQISERGGELFCRDLGDRVIISGRAVKVSETTIDK